MSDERSVPAVAVTIDEDDAIHGLRKVVVQHGPDTIYRIRPAVGRCVYVDRGSCDCLIAHVLVYLGVPIGALEQWNDTKIADVTLAGVSISDTARRVFTAAQQAQDIGETWGQSLADAEKVYADLSRGSA